MIKYNIVKSTGAAMLGHHCGLCDWLEIVTTAAAVGRSAILGIWPTPALHEHM